jgi:hypothetical protein
MTGTYVGVYQTTYALTALHLSATVAFGAPVVNRDDAEEL